MLKDYKGHTYQSKDFLKNSVVKSKLEESQITKERNYWVWKLDRLLDCFSYFQELQRCAVVKALYHFPYQCSILNIFSIFIYCQKFAYLSHDHAPIITAHWAFYVQKISWFRKDLIEGIYTILQSSKDFLTTLQI